MVVAQRDVVQALKGAMDNYHRILESVEEQTGAMDHAIRELRYSRLHLTRSPGVLPIGASSHQIADESHKQALERARRVGDKLTARIGRLHETAEEIREIVAGQTGIHVEDPSVEMPFNSGERIGG